MTSPTPLSVEDVARHWSLDHDARAFLSRVIDGDGSRGDLPSPSRRQDRARQACRRLGLVAYAGSPLRWQPTALGIAVRAALSRQEPTS